MIEQYLPNNNETAAPKALADAPAWLTTLRQNDQRSTLFSFFTAWFPNWISNTCDAHDDDEFEHIMTRSWHMEKKETWGGIVRSKKLTEENQFSL
jgi:hypothetical protein